MSHRHCSHAGHRHGHITTKQGCVFLEWLCYAWLAAVLSWSHRTAAWPPPQVYITCAPRIVAAFENNALFTQESGEGACMMVKHAITIYDAHALDSRCEDIRLLHIVPAEDQEDPLQCWIDVVSLRGLHLISDFGLLLERAVPEA